MERSIETIKHLYNVPKTFTNVKSVLKKVNEAMGWTPVDVLHVDKMVNGFTVLCSAMLASGLAHTKDELLSKLFRICGLINRMYPDTDNKLSHLCMKLKADQSGLIPNDPIPYTAPKWSTALELLNSQISNNPNPFAKIVCICFKHGYVLRIGEIFNTKLTNTDTWNHLDLDTLTWTIRIQKTKGVRVFSVSSEFKNEITPYIGPSSWLIYKSNYDRYNTHTMSTVDLVSLPSNSELRNSYETWNWEVSNRTREQRLYWSVNVLGHDEQTVIKHYLEHKLESQIMIGPSGKLRPIIKKRGPT